MLIYESLEMRESVGDESEAWKHPLPVKGLGSHFLLKVRPASTAPSLRPHFSPHFLCLARISICRQVTSLRSVSRWQKAILNPTLKFAILM